MLDPEGARRLLRDLTSDVGIAVSSSEVGFQVAKRVLDAFDFAVALERMDERAARKLSDLLGTTVSFPHHRARAGASDGFNRRAAAMPTSIRDRILREHDVDVPLEQSETYARVMNAKGADVQKVWLPGDHYDIIDVASDDWLVQLNTILDWL